MPSDCFARLTRWWRCEGAIRLEDEPGPVIDEKEALPLYWHSPGVGEEEEEYTHARLLLECVLASIWNGFCLGYLFLFPHIDPNTDEILSPRPTFLYFLLALVTLPLIFGMCAGSKAILEENEGKRQRVWFERVGVWSGTLICGGGLWGIVAFVVRKQSIYLQLDLALTTVCIQALLIRGVTGNLVDPIPEDVSDDALDVYDFLRETKNELPFSVECSSPLP
ncbi:hypothetical protein JCM16303_006645 [Sporobolomyces ruberrimus]